MILPIVALGDPILKRPATPIDEDYDGLKELIDNMFETMYEASGVGLAAPQIGKSIRLFIVDSLAMCEDEPEEEGIKKVFINAEMIKETGEEWAFEEGCLSIPHIKADVIRQENIRIRYMDENFEEHEEDFDGLNARVIQHEYDHIEGILFTDKIGSFKRRLIQSKLKDITNGKVQADYKMRFYNKR